ncbi:hypothetical protein N657DRAFT_282644 [Parathielavia appendiculata]|uniref:Uncharacterized protein n=1 Tax=Parathielavia appendiculata TaxID=2587402 RepID=A0AAN6U3T9_9PEZI|nr:hypothetical protein N657DRAFT_282644 [Parathielavia appendiculata]
MEVKTTRSGEEIPVAALHRDCRDLAQLVNLKFACPTKAIPGSPQLPCPATAFASFSLSPSTMHESRMSAKEHKAGPWVRQRRVEEKLQWRSCIFKRQIFVQLPLFVSNLPHPSFWLCTLNDLASHAVLLIAIPQAAYQALSPTKLDPPWPFNTTVISLSQTNTPLLLVWPAAATSALAPVWSI